MTEMMIRTQIYLPEDIHKRLLSLRQIWGKSAAQMIREALESYLAGSQGEGKNDLLKLADLKLSGGPKDLSSKIDDYLYGDR